MRLFPISADELWRRYRCESFSDARSWIIGCVQQTKQIS